MLIMNNILKYFTNLLERYKLFHHLNLELDNCGDVERPTNSILCKAINCNSFQEVNLLTVSTFTVFSCHKESDHFRTQYLLAW